MSDEHCKELEWYLLPQYIDLNKIILVIPTSIANIFRYDYNGNLIISIHMVNICMLFTIAEVKGRKFVCGFEDSVPMGSQSLYRFLQLYWRYRFEYLLLTSGYLLEHVKPKTDNCSFTMVFTKKGDI